VQEDAALPPRAPWLPGLGLCLAVALLAQLLARWAPVVGAPVFAILLGLAVGSTVRLPTGLRPGSALASKQILQFSIVLLGGSLSLLEVWRVGRESLAVMLGSLAVALLAAWLVGRLLRVAPRIVSLVGVGTGICGGSAIAALAPVIGADDEEVAFSISTVFLLNVVAVLVFPALGHLMRMSDGGFGIWAGTAINDTSSVVAASYSFGERAGDIATIVKLARTTMIVPITLGFALFLARREGTGRYDARRGLPWFILLFLAMAVLNTAGVFGPEVARGLGLAGRFCIAVALAGVGLGADLRRMVRTGPRPILLGAAVWAVVALSSLALQRLAGQL
jgi:uncharacterized integral membrane protein (TIGR00698 family)